MATAYSFVWRQAEKFELLKSPTGAVGRDLLRRGYSVLAGATRQVGVKTGRLRASLRVTHEYDPVYGQAVRIGSKLNYARMHHEGTRAHVILPVRAPQLVFRNRGGRLIRTDRVLHPGTKPNRYLTDNLYLSGASIIKFYTR